MKFVDPFSTLQYTGGTMAIRAGMFCYAYIIYENDYLNFPDTLKDSMKLLDKDDVGNIYLAHFFGVITILITKHLDAMMKKFKTGKEWSETLQSFAIFLRLLNVFFYTVCVMIILEDVNSTLLLGEDFNLDSMKQPFHVNVDYVR